ncbi:MAG: DUF4405 domain-containing protein [Hyphomicrobiales bacterium]
MKQFFFRYATPLVTGLFFVSLISGVALFVHVGQNYFRSMHEILSLVLIVPFVLHLWRNWRQWIAYFPRAPFIISSVLCLLVAGGFAYSSASQAGGAGGPPPMALANAVLTHTPTEVAPLLGYTPESLVEHLKQAGFTSATADQKLTDIGKAAGKDVFELAAAVLPSQ